MSQYKPTSQQRAILKIHGDLSVTIKEGKVISLKYISNDSAFTETIIVPYSIKYTQANLMLYGFTPRVNGKLSIDLDKIHSFHILRNQTMEEQTQAKQYRTNENMEELP